MEVTTEIGGNVLQQQMEANPSMFERFFPGKEMKDLQMLSDPWKFAQTIEVTSHCPNIQTLFQTKLATHFQIFRCLQDFRTHFQIVSTKWPTFMIVENWLKISQMAANTHQGEELFWNTWDELKANYYKDAGRESVFDIVMRYIGRLLEEVERNPPGASEGKFFARRKIGVTLFQCQC